MDDVWRYLLSVQSMRVAETEPFLGRCNELRDDLGEHLVAAYLVRDLIRLSLLIGRRYIPYSKCWARLFRNWRFITVSTFNPVTYKLFANYWIVTNRMNHRTCQYVCVWHKLAFVAKRYHKPRQTWRS